MKECCCDARNFIELQPTKSVLPNNKKSSLKLQKRLAIPKQKLNKAMEKISPSKRERFENLFNSLHLFCVKPKLFTYKKHCYCKYSKKYFYAKK